MAKAKTDRTSTSGRLKAAARIKPTAPPASASEQTRRTATAKAKTRVSGAQPPVTPQVTAAQAFVGSSKPIVRAFLHTEQLREGGIRKLSQDGWAQELDAFTRVPR